MELERIARRLRREVARLRFDDPVACVYNPLDYAWRPHARYLERYGRPPKEVVLVGMNPGPFGMAQTGVPFGEVTLVREWLRIHEPVKKPRPEHPKRPILGFECPRSEVSGLRLWGFVRDRFRTPRRFFARFFVHNYCPLAFLAASGRNITPDKLRPAERAALYPPCDRALARAIEHLRPQLVLGVGGFAEARARRALAGLDVGIDRLLHPSPASPAANRGWAEAAMETFHRLGVAVP